MASQKKIQQDDVQYTIYNPPASNLDLLWTRNEKYETRLHPTGQSWGDKVKRDYESCQQGGDKMPPATTSTDAMDTEEGDAITRMILDKTRAKVERRQRKLNSRGWDLDIYDILRPLSISLPENRERVETLTGWPVIAMSSLVFPEYEELKEKHARKGQNIRSQVGSPWSSSENENLETKVKIPSTSTTAFVQYTTEELDQLDKPCGWRIRGRESAQASAVLPMVYGIMPQESPADTNRESKRKETPIMDQTIIERKSKREQTSPIQEVLTKPLTQFTQNILGSSVITGKPKMMSAQTKTTGDQEPIQPDFYLPDERGSRLSEVHQIKLVKRVLKETLLYCWY